MAEYFRVLKYPLLIWFIIDTVAAAVAVFVPGFRTISNSNARLTVWSLTLGAMAGYKMIEFKGNLFHAIVAGLITALWCAVLTVTEIGFTTTPIAVLTTPAGLVAVGGSMTAVLPIGFAFFILNVIGAIIGAGFALTRGTS
jgi:hypothetical protein